MNPQKNPQNSNQKTNQPNKKHLRVRPFPVICLNETKKLYELHFTKLETAWSLPTHGKYPVETRSEDL